MRIVFFGVGEGTLAEHLSAMLQRFPELLCGSYPEFTNPEYKVRVTLESKEPEYLEAALRDLLARLPVEGDIHGGQDEIQLRGQALTLILDRR
jgi:molybdopterin-biosynthesis enzyme MoeA-like protein